MYCIVLALATFRQRLVCKPRLKGVLSHDPAVWSGLSIQKPSMSSPHSPPDLGIGGVVYKYVARRQKLYPVITTYSSEPFADHGSPVRQTTSQKSNWPLSITSAELPVSVSRQFFLLPTHPSLPGSGASLGARSFPEIRGKWGHLSAPFEFWGRTSPGQVVVIRLFFFYHHYYNSSFSRSCVPNGPDIDLVTALQTYKYTQHAGQKCHDGLLVTTCPTNASAHHLTHYTSEEKAIARMQCTVQLLLTSSLQ